MDIKDMRLFLAIAEEKNLTRAARKNGYTQSAASHILKNMETELGFPLFSRSQKGLMLTKNGGMLLPHVRRILSAAESFSQEAFAIRGIQTGHIAIGTYLSASVQWLPAALEQFYQDYPQMTVEIREGNFQEIENWLESGAIDFGICSSPDDERMDWIPLKKEFYMAVCAQDSPWARQKILNLAQLNEISYIEEKGDVDLNRQLRRLRITPPLPRYSSLNIYAMIAMARHNLGVCILPELITRDSCQNVTLLPLEPPIERTIGIRLLSLKKTSPAAALLIEQIQKAVCQMEGPAPDRAG